MIVDQRVHATSSAEVSFVDRMRAPMRDQDGRYHRDSFTDYVLSLAAAWAYADLGAMAEVMGRVGFPHCHQVSMANDAMLVQAHGYFLQSDDGAVGILCFRGTEPRNVINWLTDASIRPEAVPGFGAIHGGFYRNVLYIWPRVRAIVDEAVHGRAPSDGSGSSRLGPLESLYITGHSLGAAMAVIAGAKIFSDVRYADWQRCLHGIYTYGGPFVGDLGFARAAQPLLAGLVFRHVFDHDPVPHLPPLSTGTFFQVGREYKSGDKGWVDATDQPAKQAGSAALTATIGVAGWLTRQLRFFVNVRLPLSADDHVPLNYVRVCRDEIGSEWYGDFPSVTPPARALRLQPFAHAVDTAEEEGGSPPSP